MKDSVALNAWFDRLAASGTAMSPHMPRLRDLARDLDVVEFGVKRGCSTVAFLCSARSVWSVDLVPPRPADMTAWLTAAGGAWFFQQGDTRTITIPDCDLLLVDANHTYASVAAELTRHAHRVRRYLVFHDTITFGSIGADAETGAHLWTYVRGQSVPHAALGVRPAIDELMIRDPSWYIAAHYTESHGLLVLERRS